MVNKRLLIILAVMLSGCWYSGPKSFYGLPRKKIKVLKGIAAEQTLLDTMALYKTEIYYRINSLNGKYTDWDKSDKNRSGYTAYLKFYNEGKCGLFIIAYDDTVKLDRTFFNPQRAKMGYFTVDSSRIIRTRISTIGDGNLYISNRTGFIRNDSLFLGTKDNDGIVYIKKKVPREWLTGWKPDW